MPKSGVNEAILILMDQIEKVSSILDNFYLTNKKYLIIFISCIKKEI